MSEELFDYRMTYKYSTYVGVCGSGDTGRREERYTKEFSAKSDDLALKKARDEIAFSNRGSRSSFTCSLVDLVRIDKKEESTKILIKE